MILEANPRNIDWLIDRLYVARRYLQADGIENPVFVLLTKTTEERHEIELRLHQWFYKNYGSLDHGLMDTASNKDHSRFTFTKAGCSVVLMDMDNPT